MKCMFCGKSVDDEPVHLCEAWNKEEPNKKGTNTCKDCKWWHRFPIGEILFTECMNGKMSKEVEGETDRLWVQDSCERIETGPDFGCIHFEPKEEEK